MKNYNKRVITLIAILSLSLFNGCSPIDMDNNSTNLDDTTQNTSVDEISNDNQQVLDENVSVTDMESVEQTTIPNSSDSDIIILSESGLEVSQSVSQSDSAMNGNQVDNPSDTQVKTTQADVPTNTQGSVADGFEIPVDGSVSKNSVIVQSISLSKYEVTIAVGESDMPIVTMSPSDAEDKSEIWESSNTQVATVDSKGNITGVSEGTCTVTVKAKANTSVCAEITVTVTAKEETQESSNSDNSSNEVVEPTYIEGILVVNKTYALPKDYNPYGGGIAPEVQEAFNKMEQDARAEGLNLYISSGFRSYDYQAGLYERYAQRDGYDKADTYSARAGHSEHQTGLCFDLNTIDDSFADTPEGKWVAENCYKYGFIIRYPKGKESITGYQYEPWHLRYLGEFLATDVYNSGLCLEEYLGITSQYAD